MAVLILIIYAILLIIADGARRWAKATPPQDADKKQDKSKKDDGTIGLDEVILYDILDEDNED